MKSKIGHLIFIAVAIILAAVFIWLTVRQTNFEVLKPQPNLPIIFGLRCQWFWASYLIGSELPDGNCCSTRSVILYGFKRFLGDFICLFYEFDHTQKRRIGTCHFIVQNGKSSGWQITRNHHTWKGDRSDVSRTLFGLALIFNADTLFSFSHLLMHHRSENSQSQPDCWYCWSCFSLCSEADWGKSKFLKKRIILLQES